MGSCVTAARSVQRSLRLLGGDKPVRCSRRQPGRFVDHRLPRHLPRLDCVTAPLRRSTRSFAARVRASCRRPRAASVRVLRLCRRPPAHSLARAASTNSTRASPSSWSRSQRSPACHVSTRHRTPTADEACRRQLLRPAASCSRHRLDVQVIAARVLPQRRGRIKWLTLVGLRHGRLNSWTAAAQLLARTARPSVNAGSATLICAGADRTVS